MPYPHPHTSFVPHRIPSPFMKGLEESSFSVSEVVVGEGECYAREEESAVVDDMVKLAYLHEPGVLHNLMQRYHRNLIYTYTGSILIAANPFMRLPGIYDRDMRDAYRGQPLGELSPHVFAIADNAYRWDERVRAEHMGKLIPPPRAPSPRAPPLVPPPLVPPPLVPPPLVPPPLMPAPSCPPPHARPTISAPPPMPAHMHSLGGAQSDARGAAQPVDFDQRGERAGKTETTKLVMEYLASVGGRADSDGERSIENQVLESNPLLEAFGNAKTVRNDNSSRFGKFIEIHFDQRGRVSGAAIRSYLLERSRVVHIADPERNYHCFYQLCDGASPE
ncbi:unnamed protein product, partial [Closterium sp. NIES-64]